jgi:guanylate kinase
MSNRGNLYVLSGPSGVGKGTVRAALFENHNHQLVYSISMTTRKPREGEVDGVDYYFVDKEEFLRRVEEGLMLEWAEFVGNYYGTPLDYVEKTRDEGKNVFLEIECQGAMQVKEKVKDAILLFLAPPSLEELTNRLKGRGTESEEVIQKRLNKATEEMELREHYDYVVVNNTVDGAVSDILDIIEKEA